MHKLILLLLGMTLAPSALALDQQALMRVFFSVVLVRGYDAEGSLAYGSGVVIAENKVVTNCHVLRRTRQAWVSQGEDAYPIVSVHADTVHDLCLLNLERLPQAPVQLGSTKTLKVGAEVASIGHSNGVPSPISSAGQVKSLYAYGAGKVIRTNARFAMGASGSPLFDAQGRLIGINTFKTPGRHAYFYAMPVEWLASLAQQPAQTTLPISGQAFWERPDSEKPFFMQVALPHLNEEWSNLLDIARRWTAVEAESADAWYELGSAHEGLGEHAAAEKAYGQAAHLDPTHGEALLRLGLYASRRGDADQVGRIRVQLSEINGTLLQDFERGLRCESAC